MTPAYLSDFRRRRSFATRALAWLLCGLSAASTSLTANEIDVSVEISDQQFTLRWRGESQLLYRAESSTDLSAWTELSPVLTGVGAELSFTGSANGLNRCFYRVKRVASIMASYQPATQILTITGDDLDNAIVVSRDASGGLLVNGGAVAINGGKPTTANTALIQIFGREGRDTLSLDEASGPMPKAQMFGEAGDDTLTGGSGADLLDGGVGDDTLLGKGGADNLLGGDDHDVITGGDADDIVQLGSGNDRFVWNPGDDTDLVEGGDGSDAVEVNGGNGAEVFTATANGLRVRFDRVNPAPFSLDLGACERLHLKANGGDDSFSATGNLAALIAITVNGGTGSDTLLGSNGGDVLMGDEDDDFIDGQQGNDAVFMGQGDDIFQWDPGDGSDAIEGQEGSDRLLFNASAANEIIDLSAVGSRLRFTRNIGAVALDVDGVERVDHNALGGTDTIVVNNLAGTTVTQVNINLAGALGGVSGDALSDTVIVNGSGGADVVDVSGSGTSFNLTGLSALVSVTNSESANDALVVNGLAGGDALNASMLFSGVVKLTLDGGSDGDTLIGSQGADVLLGGDNEDLLDGRQGADVVLMGAGGDTFQWNPGDGSDVLEGQDGLDTLLLSGANVPEDFDLAANGSRLRIFRNVAAVTLDCDGLEKVEIRALGGADNFVVGELTTTDVTDVTVNLAGPGDGGDGEADHVTLNATQANDTFGVHDASGNVMSFGLSATLTILAAESAIDGITLNALGGADTVDCANLGANAPRLTINGGLGNDTMLGGAGGDTFIGGDGNDLAFGGAGDDTMVWNPGDDNDTLEGQAGVDTLLFNGANVAENITLSANGARLRFTRDVASVVIDADDLERVRFNALGGADNILINSLAGTDVTDVNVNLAAFGGAGDTQQDSVTVFGTETNDVVTLSGVNGNVQAFGLSAMVSVTGSEAANDRLTLRLMAGDDVADASAVASGVIGYTADGGNDHDVLIGSDGPDTLIGGDGDDVLLGGPGIDVLDGGAGANVLIQD